MPNKVKDFLYDYSIRIQSSLGIVFLVFGQTPLEYAVAIGLFAMSIWDYFEGRPV
jgi:hypothetical protein